MLQKRFCRATTDTETTYHHCSLLIGLLTVLFITTQKQVGLKASVQWIMLDIR